MRTVAKIIGWFIKIFTSETRKDVIEDIVFMEPSIYLPKEQIDYCIVLGGDRKRANQAAKLYHEHKVKTIVASGGLGTLSENYHGLTEVEIYCGILIDGGVSPRDILVEMRSTNTRENLDFSLDKIIWRAVKNGYSPYYCPKEIVIVTSDFHMRRTLLTIKELNPYIQVYYVGVDSGDANRSTWRKTAWGCFVVYKEYRRLLKLMD